MRRSVALAGLLAILAAAASAIPATPAAPTAAPPAASSPTAAARRLLDQLVAGDVDAAEASFDDAMRKALPAEALRNTWKMLLAQVGAFERVVGTRQEGQPPYDVVLLTSKFARASIDVKVVLDPQRRVAGLSFLPPSPAAAAAATASSAAGRPAGVEEKDVQVGSGEWALPGTLTLPAAKGTFPAIVLVHGSGPNDRDESLGPNKPFRDLAWGLAERGVATLRYDKRTRVHAARMGTLPDLTVKEETVDDAVAAVALLRSRPEIDPRRIVVLGHSLGGMLLPRIGAADARIAGFISLAGATRPIEEMMVEQLVYLAGLDGSVSPDERERLDRVRAQAGRIQDPHLARGTPASELLGAPAPYWLDLRGYRPAEAARKLQRPLLVLQGESDYQVTMVDFANWKTALAGQPEVTFRSFPGLGHLFIAVPSKGSPQDYERPGRVASEVIDEIARWTLACCR